MTLATRDTGTGAAKACRRKGLVPAIIYGRAFDPVPVALDRVSVRKLMSGGHIHRVAVGDSSEEANVMVKDTAYDPVTGRLIHVDLLRVSMTEKVRAEVIINIIGEDKLDHEGLLLQKQLLILHVECLPGDIPDAIELDVSHLSAGETVTVGDLPVPDAVKPLTPPDEVVVVALVPSRAEVEEEEGEEAAEGEGPEHEPNESTE